MKLKKNQYLSGHSNQNMYINHYEVESSGLFNIDRNQENNNFNRHNHVIN